MCSFWYVECLSRMGDLHKARFFFEKMLGFTICSFWLVSALCEIGEINKARKLCTKLLSFAGPLEPYGEEIDAYSGQHLGNFPQAFTHLALISAAFDLDRRLSVAGHAG